MPQYLSCMKLDLQAAAGIPDGGVFSHGDNSAATQICPEVMHCEIDESICLDRRWKR